jgi:hypothetical protein
VAQELQAPESADALYLARGDEVSRQRPVFTGDVYLTSKDDSTAIQASMFLIVQHPCALRTNGVQLVSRILVAEVESCAPISLKDWNGRYRIMPLPGLRPVDVDARSSCAVFPNLLVVTPGDLAACERIACLSDVGVNLLLQRWVHHNSRAIVQTHVFAQVTAGPLAEAEIVEEWIASRQLVDMGRDEAEAECHAFLRDVPDGSTISRQKALEDPQRRSEVRRAVRAQLKVPHATP